MITMQHFKLLIVFLTMKRTQRQLKKLLLVSGVSLAFVVFLFKYARRLKRMLFRPSNARKTCSSNQVTNVKVHPTQINTKSSPSFNRQFLNELLFLMRIMFPKFVSKQTSLLLMHTGTLICRTFLSLYVAKLEGLLVKNIVRKDFNLFARNLLQWLLIAVPAVSCNSLIKYLESKLDIELKSQLVNHSLSFYFRDRIYYRIALKQNENVQIDQNLTDDIEKLTHLLVHLYSQLTKPILDISLITVTLISLAKQNNFNYLFPTAIAFIVIFCTGFLMRILSPKFGKMAANVAKQKGYLRFLYTRIQTNSEEIAFYSGEKTESTLIRKNYAFLKAQMEKIHLSKLWYVVVEQFLLKYVWSAAGLTMISLPILLSERNIHKNKSSTNDLDAQANELEISERTEQFTTAKNLLISAADAVERIMTSYKELIELTGFTRRVYDMFQMFESAKRLDETRVDVRNDQNSAVAQLATSNKDQEVSDSFKALNNNPMGVVYESADQNSIIVESISIVTPAGDLIVPSLTLKIEQGMNLLITGPNGCGKSSLFRIISGLWPLYKGKITRPRINELFYVPQRPYLAIGSLRDQIIYPDSLDDMRKKRLTDADLMKIVEIVNLQQVVIREGGLDAIADWKDVLSGGEKQRLGLSRLFYHKPKFAFLDECTSAISIDVEGKIYLSAINDYGITLLTIAHRATLWQYHNYILQFDGRGSWKFDELNHNLNDRLNLKQEKDSLEKLLMSVSNSTNRLKELCQILGEDSIALETT